MPAFEQILRQFHDKVTARNIADTVASNPDRMPELMDCFFHEEMRICQRASWPVGMLGQEHSSLLLPYLDQMLAAIHKPQHNAVIRNTLRTFQYMNFPEDVEGQVFDVCLTLLMNHDNAIAVKVFSMTVCANICKKYPDLAVELVPVIEEQLPHGSAGFKARGAKLVKMLNALQTQIIVLLTTYLLHI